MYLFYIVSYLGHYNALGESPMNNSPLKSSSPRNNAKLSPLGISSGGALSGPNSTSSNSGGNGGSSQFARVNALRQNTNTTVGTTSS